jgi:hypothetical protein
MRLKASDAALPLWADFMKQALELRTDLGGSAFARPGGIVTVDIDPETGLIASADCPDHRQEIFVSGTEPYATCSHQVIDDTALLGEQDQALPASLDEEPQGEGLISLQVCAETGLIASAYCPRATTKAFESGKGPAGICGSEMHRRVNRTEPPISEPVIAPGDKEGYENTDRTRTNEDQGLRRTGTKPRARKNDLMH